MLTLTRYWTETRPVYKGILLMTLAGFAFSCMDTIAKLMSAHYDPFQVVWARYASQTFWSLVVLAPFLKHLLKTRYLKLQILRSGLLFGATLAFFSALPYLKLAELVAIFEVAPLLITCLSFLILKEKVSWPRWVGVTIGLLGA
ncbi:MAG: DMT family transporter, partial [bacterium]